MASKHVIKQDSTTTFEIKQDDSTWILKAGVVVDVADGFGFSVLPAAKDTRLVIAGQIGDTNSTMWDGIINRGKDTRVEIANSGSVEGKYRGMTSLGDNFEVINQGTITGSAAGLDLDGKNYLVRNSGLITTSDLMDGDAILLDSGFSSGKIINEEGGTIEGIFNAINGGPVTFINRGTIADVASKSIEVYLGYGDDRFVNRGTLDGAAFLGEGNDVADLRNGSTTSIVSGGLGNDTYIVNQNDGQAYEYAGQGIDTLKTSVSFTATQAGEMEKFVAIGKANITIVANDLDNSVTGNRGKNLLDGGAGDDILRGGKGIDTFDFGTGGDSDRIMDFQNGVDRIDVSGWNTIDDFADIQAIVTVSGDDLVLTLGNDDITIKDMKMSELNAGDFIF
ncbi:calcium-binding protein [Rhizobium sp. TH2]|uniref:calcium-binding protein n=1 Tax=Rhizobium sp. TH2 TaxID=2775403 RepID=UPI00215814AE|nr:calcium-binding protein [Rhizobium sp. TH2]UVC08042.1 calcium-binding protein [Rhizobium sp. TH2]